MELFGVGFTENGILGVDCYGFGTRIVRRKMAVEISYFLVVDP
jgi:hypothetical protein